jgi:hypothetical protein
MSASQIGSQFERKPGVPSDTDLALQSQISTHKNPPDRATEPKVGSSNLSGRVKKSLEKIDFENILTGL